MNGRLLVRATITFLYYRDLARAAAFYETVLGLPLVVQQRLPEAPDFCRIYRISPTGYVGLVDERHGAHRADEGKAVNLSLVVDDPEAWHDHLRAHGVTITRPPRESPALHIRGFMALDPEGYTLEFETFLPHPANAGILA
jgi:predicted enzyme related to lactoylglutathione lyase